jgi:hypothetical protein
MELPQQVRSQVQLGNEKNPNLDWMKKRQEKKPAVDNH